MPGWLKRTLHRLVNLPVTLPSRGRVNKSKGARRRLFVAALLLVPAAVPVALVAQDMSNEEQKDFLTNFVQDRLSTPERQIRLSNIEGALGSDVSIREITISDAEGVWLRVNNASLNWNQAALFGGRLEVNALRADSIEYIRNAIPVEGSVDLPPPEAGTLEIPEFPVAIQIGELAVPSVRFGEGVFGLGSEISLAGSMTLDGGNLDAALDIVRLDGPGGTLDLRAVYRQEDNTIELGLSLVEPPNGVLANLLNIEGRPAMKLTLEGEGPVSDLTTQMRLLANESEALAGTATIAQTDAGFAVSANLGGPISTLVAQPYQDFFGAQTRLTAEVLVRSAGGLDISNLTLSGGQLGLAARAQTTPDNFLSLLDLSATIADPDGGKVILPVPGAATLVQGGQLRVAFGTEGREDWQARFDLEGFETDGFAARTFGLGIGGVARNLSDPTSRMVTFNGDGALSGISADPGVEAALGERVVAEVDHDVVVDDELLAEREVVGERDVAADRAEGLGGHQHRLVAQRAADEEASQQRAGGRAGVVGAVDRPLRCLVAEPGEHGLGDGGEVALAAAEQAQLDGRAKHLGLARQGLGDLGCGRLRHHHDQVDVGVGVEAAQGLAGGEAADRGGQVATADAQRVAYAHSVQRLAGVVEQGEQLLAAGAGRGDQADAARADGVGEAEAHPVEQRGAAVGTHDEGAARGGVRLERDLLRHGDVVAEDHHVVAGLEGVHRLDRGARARHRDEHDGPGASVAQGRAGGARRGLRGVARRRARGDQGRVDGRERGGDLGVVVEPERDDHVVGRGGRDIESHALEHLEVKAGGHGHLRGDHAGGGLHRPADLEQGHRVGVCAAPELDVVLHAALPGRSVIHI